MHSDYAFGRYPGLRWRGRVVDDQGSRIKVQQCRSDGNPEGLPFWTSRGLLTGTWAAEEAVRGVLALEEASWNQAEKVDLGALSAQAVDKLRSMWREIRLEIEDAYKA